MNVVLFDEPLIRADLLPFTFTRPVSSIRVGILTIQEKWDQVFQTKSSFFTEAYLQTNFPPTIKSDNLFINGALCPNPELNAAICSLEKNQSLYHHEVLLAGRTSESNPGALKQGKAVSFQGPYTIIAHVWDIFTKNGDQIRADFELITKGKSSFEIGDRHTIIYGGENIFIEEGVSIKACTLNAENGPIYLGRNSTVMEGTVIKGPFALCESALLNMNSKMRGDATIGPFCKVGGEVSNSVIFGCSSKLHDGFLGNSVIGEWCNLGADTNSSNMKNNYDVVKLWNYPKGRFTDTGLQFCGLMMGDHSKCGINTMFNTGTVVGVSANIFGSGYPRQFIPSFSWGGAQGFTTFQLDKAIETAERAVARRNRVLTDADKGILGQIFELTRGYRKKESH